MIGQCLASITLGICIGDECTGSTEFAVIRTLVDQTTKTGSKHFRVDALEYFDINTVSFGLFHDLMLCLTFCSVQEFRLQMHLIFISISALNIIMSLVAVFRLAPTRPRSIMFYVLFNFLFILGDIGLGVFSSLNLSEVLNQVCSFPFQLPIGWYHQKSNVFVRILRCWNPWTNMRSKVLFSGQSSN